jgi:hypothetical protein
MQQELGQPDAPSGAPGQSTPYGQACASIRQRGALPTSGQQGDTMGAPGLHRSASTTWHPIHSSRLVVAIGKVHAPLFPVGLSAGAASAIRSRRPNPNAPDPEIGAPSLLRLLSTAPQPFAHSGPGRSTHDGLPGPSLYVSYTRNSLSETKGGRCSCLPFIPLPSSTISLIAAIGNVRTPSMKKEHTSHDT